MNLNLDQKVILVTGRANGIREGIVKVLAGENAVPVIIGRNQEDNLKTLATIGDKGFQVTAELTRSEECENAVSQVIHQYHRIDGLVNNAGEDDGVDGENGNYQDFIASLHQYLVHYYLMTHHALPYLKQSNGSIVNIGSETGHSGHGTSAFAASSGGRKALTREWAVELIDYRIRVNEVVVADCYTPLYEKWMKSFDGPGEKLKSIPANLQFEKRMPMPEEIANIVVFLLSERSSHTTGQIIHVDQGYVHLDWATS